MIKPNQQILARLAELDTDEVLMSWLDGSRKEAYKRAVYHSDAEVRDRARGEAQSLDTIIDQIKNSREQLKNLRSR